MCSTSRLGQHGAHIARLIRYTNRCETQTGVRASENTTLQSMFGFDLERGVYHVKTGLNGIVL